MQLTVHERVPSNLVLDLPENATAEQLQVIEAYLRQQNKIIASNGYGTKNYYKERHEILGSKLIIFLNNQKKKDIWYMRMHVGGKQAYKRISLKTSDKSIAIERALDYWRNLKNHIDAGGNVFEETINKVLEDYRSYLSELVETEQIKKHTLRCKFTSLKKLVEYLSPYQKPSDIPFNVLDDYTKWRRTKNWTKYHKNNSKPPSDLTINRELADFKGFFDWCSKKKLMTNNIEYPWIKYDPKKHKESSPPFSADDYGLILRNLTRWYSDKELAKTRKNNFYRGVFVYYFEILAQSGMRPHECLKLRWSDVEIISEFEKVEYQILNDGEGTLVPDQDSIIITTMCGTDIITKTENMPPRRYFTMQTLENIEKSVKKGRNWFEVEFLGAKVEVSADTKTGRRVFYCPAGFAFQRLWEYYKVNSPIKPRRNDYIFQNVGSSHSKMDKYIGKSLNDTFLRRMWYEFRDYLVSKGTYLNPDYTLYSCRSFFINLNLEAGNKPHQVAKMVGHSISTQSKHYEAMEVRQLATRFSKITEGQIRQSRIDLKFVDEI
jgi:integrase